MFIDEVKKAGLEGEWDIDSAAIGPWHAGRNPDNRAMDTMKKHNLAYNNKARQIKTPDFNKFDYIFGMDDENIDDLNGLRPKDASAKVLLLGDFDPEGDRIIRDPYYVRQHRGNPNIVFHFYVIPFDRIAGQKVSKNAINKLFDVARDFWHKLKIIKFNLLFIENVPNKMMKQKIECCLFQNILSLTESGDVTLRSVGKFVDF